MLKTILLDLDIISSAIVVILVFWIVVGYKHLKRLQKDVKAQWELIDDDLRKRHDILPNLIETIRMYDKNQEKFIEQVIGERTLAIKAYDPDISKIEAEHDLSMSINKLFDLGKGNAELSTDTNFLELKKEIKDLEENADAKTRKYNDMVRYYNKHRNLIIFKPIAVVFGFKMLNIFEVET